LGALRLLVWIFSDITVRPGRFQFWDLLGKYTNLSCAYFKQEKGNVLGQHGPAFLMLEIHVSAPQREKFGRLELFPATAGEEGRNSQGDVNL
jgi:hypothetical protein